MCEFHESTCNGFGDIWWTDNPIYFSSIDVIMGGGGITIGNLPHFILYFTGIPKQSTEA